MYPAIVLSLCMLLGVAPESPELEVSPDVSTNSYEEVTTVFEKENTTLISDDSTMSQYQLNPLVGTAIIFLRDEVRSWAIGKGLDRVVHGDQTQKTIDKAVDIAREEIEYVQKINQKKHKAFQNYVKEFQSSVKKLQRILRKNKNDLTVLRSELIDLHNNKLLPLENKVEDLDLELKRIARQVEENQNNIRRNRIDIDVNREDIDYIMYRTTHYALSLDGHLGLAQSNLLTQNDAFHPTFGAGIDFRTNKGFGYWGRYTRARPEVWNILSLSTENVGLNSLSSIEAGVLAGTRNADSKLGLLFRAGAIYMESSNSWGITGGLELNVLQQDFINTGVEAYLSLLYSYVPQESKQITIPQDNLSFLRISMGYRFKFASQRFRNR